MKDIFKRNNVKVSGEGRETMMFAHGFIGDQTLWRLIVPSFEKKYRVVLFDYVGSGKSDCSLLDPVKYSKLEGYAEDVIEICTALNLKDVIFVGHSISSMIGLIASMRSPVLFSKMIFIGPSPCYTNEGTYLGGFEKKDLYKIIDNIEADYDQWAKQLAPRVMNAPDRPHLAQELEDSLLSRDHNATKFFATATFFADYRRSLLNFKVPSLIMQCDDDIMAPLQVGDYLHAHLENSTLKRLKCKGHFPQLSAPEEIVKAITQYLSE
jgi:sigma-B regulation protein RsbQ